MPVTESFFRNSGSEAIKDLLSTPTKLKILKVVIKMKEIVPHKGVIDFVSYYLTNYKRLLVNCNLNIIIYYMIYYVKYLRYTIFEIYAIENRDHNLG